MALASHAAVIRRSWKGWLGADLAHRLSPRTTNCLGLARGWTQTSALAVRLFPEFRFKLPVLSLSISGLLVLDLKYSCPGAKEASHVVCLDLAAQPRPRAQLQLSRGFRPAEAS